MSIGTIIRNCLLLPFPLHSFLSSFPPLALPSLLPLLSLSEEYTCQMFSTFFFYLLVSWLNVPLVISNFFSSIFKFSLWISDTCIQCILFISIHYCLPPILPSAPQPIFLPTSCPLLLNNWACILAFIVLEATLQATGGEQASTVLLPSCKLLESVRQNVPSGVVVAQLLGE